MKTTETYEAPLVEVIEVEVERGFATSPDATGNESIENGGTYPFS